MTTYRNPCARSRTLSHTTGIKGVRVCGRIFAHGFAHARFSRVCECAACASLKGTVGAAHAVAMSSLRKWSAIEIPSHHVGTIQLHCHFHNTHKLRNRPLTRLIFWCLGERLNDRSVAGLERNSCEPIFDTQILKQRRSPVRVQARSVNEGSQTKIISLLVPFASGRGAS